MIKKNYALVVILMLVALNAFAIDYPEPTSWVNDYAGILNSDQQQELDGILKDFETATTNQIFVCVMESLPADTSLGEYVNELFERWQPGQKDKDNGVLLAIFIDDRVLRIEVGYGLEENLTDAVSALIITDEITPAFKQGDYYQGIKNGINSMILATKNAYHPQSQPQDTHGYTIPQDSFFYTILRTIYQGTVNSKIWKNVLSKIFPTFGTFVITLIVLLPSGIVLLSSLWNLYRNRGSTIGSSGSRSRRSSWSSRSSSWSSSSSSSSFSGGGGGSSGGGGASGSW